MKRAISRMASPNSGPGISTDEGRAMALKTFNLSGMYVFSVDKIRSMFLTKNSSKLTGAYSCSRSSKTFCPPPVTMI